MKNKCQPGKICFDKMFFYCIIIILFIIVLYFHSFLNYKKNNKYNSDENKKYNSNRLDKIENKLNNLKYKHNEPECRMDVNYNHLNSIDRIYNPLRFPYKNSETFNRGPCTNSLFNYNCRSNPINNPSIINYATRPYCDQIQQLGVASKVNGTVEEIYPLYGRQKYRNRNQWEYYVKVNDVKLITKAKGNFKELENNDIIEINQLPGTYLISVYENDQL
jgi:hypothetical protein